MQRPLSRDDILKLRTEVFFDFNQPEQLSSVFKAALQPVNAYAPLGAYYQIYDALRRMVEGGFEPGEGVAACIALHEELESYFLSRECRRNYAPNYEDDYIWARVVIVLTMRVFTESGDDDISEELLQAYLNTVEGKSTELILAEIQRLYRVASKTPAGGAAFHFIASTLLLSTELSSHYMRETKYQALDDYLELARRLNRYELNHTGELKFRNLSPGGDHCLAYLRDQWLERTAPRGDGRIAAYDFGYLNGEEPPGQWWPRPRRAAPEERVEVAPPRERTVTAVMIGPSGSGKTTLVRELVRASQQDIELGVGLQILYGPSHEGSIKALEKAPPPGTQQMLRLQGIIFSEEPRAAQPKAPQRQAAEAGGTVFNIFDSKGGSMFADPPQLGGERPAASGQNGHPDTRSESEKLYEVTANADLLVLFIPPEFLIESRQAGGINWETLEIYFSNFIAQVLQWNKNAMIAFAYTKCDEYGVRLGRTRRIVEEEPARAAMEAFRSADERRELLWQVFVSAASRRGEGGASPLIGDLLHRTGALWRNTLRKSRHRFLNGYLVAADPVVDNLGNGAARAGKDWESLGLLQIFADFFAHLKATKAI